MFLNVGSKFNRCFNVNIFMIYNDIFIVGFINNWFIIVNMRERLIGVYIVEREDIDRQKVYVRVRQIIVSLKNRVNLKIIVLRKFLF